MTQSKSPARLQAGFAPLIILLVIAFIVLIGGVVVYQKVFAPKSQPTPIPVASPSPILTPAITAIPSSLSQPSPTPDPTADWVTYRNQDLGFSIKYPKTITLAKEFKGNGAIFARKNDALANNEGFYPISLQIYRRNGDDPQQALKSETCGGCTSVPRPITINNATGINTKTGGSGIVLTEDFSNTFDYYLTDGKSQGPVLRLFVQINSNEISNADKEAFITMLNTFRFER